MGCRMRAHQEIKLLFDESLSPKLVELLRDLFPCSTDTDFERLPRKCTD